jgi:hypothetical protein
MLTVFDVMAVSNNMAEVSVNIYELGLLSPFLTFAVLYNGNYGKDL